jgi:hypothetical protein
VKSVGRERLGRAGARVARAGALLARTARALARRAGWPRGAALLLGAGVAGLGLHGMIFWSTLPDRLPSALDWRAAAALLARDGRAGDAVALAPWWAERAREVLPAALPVLAFPRLAGEDLPGVRRVWLLALPDAPGHGDALEHDLVARAAAIDGPQRLGALTLTRFDLRAPVVPMTFLPDRLAAAQIALGGRPCAADARGGFRCGAPAIAVAREVREVDLLPRPCVVTSPPPDAAAPLAVTFPGVRLGRALRGHAGAVGEAALGGEAPIQLRVNIDGQDVGGVELAPGDTSWRAFEADTVRQAGRAHDVTFTVTAVADEDRLLCFDAYALP